MPRPDHLIAMCEAIYIARMTGEIFQEQKLYYELINILRSPQILKLITDKHRDMMKLIQQVLGLGDSFVMLPLDVWLTFA
jgi:hypothetical protein